VGFLGGDVGAGSKNDTFRMRAVRVAFLKKSGNFWR